MPAKAGHAAKPAASPIKIVPEKKMRPWSDKRTRANATHS
jgi:hypothetical protein